MGVWGHQPPSSFLHDFHENHLKFPDAPEASPDRWGAPFAIVMYYHQKMADLQKGTIESLHAP
jgi:hypothetical protein